MDEKKKIPCRVCGKPFKPCAYCQSHADTFRWRNFACSKECATKYINDTIAYRESLKKKSEMKNKEVKEEISFEKHNDKKNNNKNKTTNTVEIKTENNETE